MLNNHCHRVTAQLQLINIIIIIIIISPVWGDHGQETGRIGMGRQNEEFHLQRINRLLQLTVLNSFGYTYSA
jgi:hypothetical protein